jgi:predicted nucleic acid-binding protein
MRTAYFDSSALLSILLQEAKAETVATLWDEHTQRVSSILLNAECWVGMRRFLALNRMKPEGKWLEERSDFLSDALASVQIMPVDARVMEIMKSRAELAECRTMDALHLATALYFSTKGDEGIVVVSLDDRMRQAAKRLDLEVLPAA